MTKKFRFGSSFQEILNRLDLLKKDTSEKSKGLSESTSERNSQPYFSLGTLPWSTAISPFESYMVDINRSATDFLLDTHVDLPIITVDSLDISGNITEFWDSISGIVGNVSINPVSAGYQLAKLKEVALDLKNLAYDADIYCTTSDHETPSVDVADESPFLLNHEIGHLLYSSDFFEIIEDTLSAIEVDEYRLHEHLFPSSTYSQYRYQPSSLLSFYGLDVHTSLCPKILN